MPHLNQLHAQYKDDGLVLIGVHTKKSGGSAAAFVEAKGIQYPVCVDSSGTTVRSFRANSFPDYFVIDRNGVLRYADLSNTHVDAVVKKLIAEPAPGSTHLSRLRQVVARQPQMALGGIPGEKPGSLLDMVFRTTFGQDGSGPWLEVESVVEDTLGKQPRQRSVVRLRADEGLTLLRQRTFVQGKLVTDLTFGEGKLRGRLARQTVLRNVPAGLSHEAAMLFLAKLLALGKAPRASTLALLDGGALSHESAHLLRLKNDPERPGVISIAWMMGAGSAKTVFDFDPKGQLLGLRKESGSRRIAPLVFQVLEGEKAAALFKRLLPKEG